MTPQEAQIIEEVFTRLAAAGPAPADPEAAGLIEAKLRADRGAGLALVRAVVMLERERAALAEQNHELTQRLEATAASTPASGGGLFGGAPAGGAGPWGSAPRAPGAPAAPGPWGTQAVPGPWGAQAASGPWGQAADAPAGGGFWGSALRTGAGVAGGLFAFEALKGLFGGGHGAQAGLFGGGATPAGGLFDQPQTVINETVNVFQGGGDERTTGGAFGGEPAALQDIAADDAGYDDIGTDDDSWA